MHVPGGDVDPHLVQARRKFASLLENTVLDYKHYHPSQLEACIQTLDTLFGNVVSHPDEQKYRRIKATNKKFLNNVTSVKHTEELMLQAGWRPKVVEMEKSWVFEAEPASAELQRLAEFHSVLQRSLATIHAKAERKAKEDEERRSKHAGERERILLAIEDDRGQRQLIQTATAHAGPVAAQPLPSEVAAPAAGGSRGGRHRPGPGEDGHSEEEELGSEEEGDEGAGRGHDGGTGRQTGQG